MGCGDEFSAETGFPRAPSADMPGDGRRRSDQNAPSLALPQSAAAGAVITVGVIDADPFIRDCITNSLKGACQDIEVATFADCREVRTLKVTNRTAVVSRLYSKKFGTGMVSYVGRRRGDVVASAG